MFHATVQYGSGLCTIGDSTETLLWAAKNAIRHYNTTNAIQSIMPNNTTPNMKLEIYENEQLLLTIRADDTESLLNELKETLYCSKNTKR